MVATTRSQTPKKASGQEMDEKFLTGLLAHMDQPKYKGDVLSSLKVALITIVGQVCIWSAAYYGSQNLTGPVRQLALFACMLLWAGMTIRAFIVFHDCGHGSFIQGFKGASKWNTFFLHLFAASCATPTDWNKGHDLHHCNVGNLDQDNYDWGETIFHTKAQFLALPAWKKRVLEVVRHPVPFFILAPVLTWYFKMRLPFELRAGRKANYRFSDKMINLIWTALRYYAASQCGILPVILTGDAFGMGVGIILFHWQHVYENGYVVDSNWSRHEASLLGSSMLKVPPMLRWITVGIEYHHIHHLRIRMPGYMLGKCHEDAPAGMWDSVVVLSYKQMWDSLFMQVYDEDKGTYSTFAEIQRDAKQV